MVKTIFASIATLAFSGLVPADARTRIFSRPPELNPPVICDTVTDGDTSLRVVLPGQATPILNVGPNKWSITTDLKPDAKGCAVLSLAGGSSFHTGDAITVEAFGKTSSPVTVQAKKTPPEPELTDRTIVHADKDDRFVTGRAPEGDKIELQVRDKDGKIISGFLPVTASANNGFTVELDAKLNCGDAVSAYEGGHPNEPFSKATIECDPPPAPRVVYTPKEGDTSVSGVGKNLEKVEVLVKSGDRDVQHKTTDVNADSGEFTAKVDKLVAGQTIVVTGLAGKARSAPKRVNVDPVDFEWGRVRAYFTAGAILSQGGKNFSSPDAFVGFNIDKNWLLPKQGRMRFNTFFDTRLASIAVSSDAKTSPSTPKAAAGSGTADVTANDCTTPSSKTEALDTFVASCKAAVLQVGLYAPIVFTKWHFRGEANSLTVAPLAKIGFATPTKAAERQFYSFNAYGFRVAHFHDFNSIDDYGRETTNTNYSPELISYLDVTVGRFANFETAKADNNQVRARLKRASFEGILHVPYTPLIVGFNANVALEHRSGFKSINQDDLRFLFGTRFDVGKLFAKLVKF